MSGTMKAVLYLTTILFPISCKYIFDFKMNNVFRSHNDKWLSHFATRSDRSTVYQRSDYAFALYHLSLESCSRLMKDSCYEQGVTRKNLE